ncbi:hypothetical protein M1D97_01915 [Kushneria sp. AK178]
MNIRPGILIALAALYGCAGHPPEPRGQGLVFEAAGDTHRIERACVSSVVLERDDAANPVVFVEMVDSPECSGGVWQFTEAHVGGQMSTRFNDQYIARDASVYGAIGDDFRFRVESDELGRAVVDHYR